MEYLKNDMTKKISCGGVYQCIKNISVDYHAGLFFVYKFTKYLRFFPDGKLSYMDRIEGQKDDDDNYNKVYNLLENCDTKIEVQNVEWNENLIRFTVDEVDYTCGPSILSELINPKNNYTQLFVNYTNDHKNETDIYIYIYHVIMKNFSRIKYK